MGLNTSTGLVTDIIFGRWDRHKFKKLVDKDLGKATEIGTVASDKGYDDGDDHRYLKKKDKIKQGWPRLTEIQEYTDGL